MPLKRRRGGGSAGPTIVEATEAPAGTNGLIWRNAGVHKVYLDSAWRPLTYYNGDKAQPHIYLSTFPSTIAPYLDDDYLGFDASAIAITGFFGALNYPLQQGQYVELVVSTSMNFMGYFALGLQTTTGLTAQNSLSYVPYYSRLYYDGSSYISFGSEHKAYSIVFGVSRDAGDKVHFYIDGTSMGLVPAAYVDNLAGWYPRFYSASNNYNYVLRWHVDASDMEYMPSGFAAINEQTP